MPAKERTIARLRRQLDELASLLTQRDAVGDLFTKWYRATRVAIENSFGADSRHVDEFKAVTFTAPIITPNTTDSDKQWWHEAGLRRAKSLLEGFISEIDEYWDDSGVTGSPDAPADAGSDLKIFISHRSTDKDLAKAVADLLRRAMLLSGTEIRCTSVDGHRLKGGADTATELRREVLYVPAFIGLITPASATSAYVLFELGARWGAGRHLCPVFGQGADEKSLGGPLGGKNALHLSNRGETIQMVEEIAAVLDKPLEPWNSLDADIDGLVKLASTMVTPAASSKKRKEQKQRLDKTEVEILEYIAEDRGSTAADLAQGLALSLEKARYYMARLVAADYVEYVENWATREQFYSLAQRGRESLVQRGLL